MALQMLEDTSQKEATTPGIYYLGGLVFSPVHGLASEGVSKSESSGRMC